MKSINMPMYHRSRWLPIDLSWSAVTPHAHFPTPLTQHCQPLSHLWWLLYFLVLFLSLPSSVHHRLFCFAVLLAVHAWLCYSMFCVFCVSLFCFMWIMNVNCAAKNAELCLREAELMTFYWLGWVIRPLSFYNWPFIQTYRPFHSTPCKHHHLPLPAHSKDTSQQMPTLEHHLQLPTHSPLAHTTLQHDLQLLMHSDQTPTLQHHFQPLMHSKDIQWQMQPYNNWHIQPYNKPSNHQCKHQPTTPAASA